MTSLFSGGAGSLFSSLNLEKLDINLEKNNTISILPNITLPPLLSADIQIAPLSAQLQSDSGITLISASIDAISLKGTGLQVLAPSVKLLLSPQEDAAVALGKTLSGAVFNAPSYLAIGVVHVGDVSGRLNMLFSAIRIRISINKLIYPATADPSIDVKPAITPVAAASVSLPARLGASLKFSSGDSSSFTSSDAFLAASLVSDSVSSSLPQRPAATLDLTLNQGSIDATALGISAKLALKLISQLPINTLIPYLSLRTGLDDLDAIRLDMIGLGLAKGAKDYDIGIDLVFGQDQGLPAKIAEIVNGLVNSESKITSNIIVQGLRLGPSIEESYGLLDRLNVSIPGFAISLLPQLLKKNESEVAAAAASTTAPLFNFHMDGLDGFSLGTVAPQIDSLDISTGSSSFVFGAGASLYNPFPISLSIPFAGVSAIVDGSNVANADLTGLVIGKSGRQSVNLALALGFSTAADVPGKVARLVNGLIAGKIDSSITLTGIMFGISRSQSVKALSLLELPLNLSGIRSSSSSGFSLASIFPALANAKLSSLIPTINSLDIATAPRATLEAGIGAFLSNSLPVTLDVPYLAASLLLNGRQMLALTLQGAKIGRGANSINVKLSAALSNDAQIQGDVSRIVKDLVSGKGVTGVTVAISGILVGPNSQEAVHALEQVIFDIPLTGGSSIDLSQILPWINNINLGSFKPSLAGLDISTIEQGLSVEGALSIHNPIPVTAKIGYLSLSAALGDAQLLDLSVSDIQLVLSDQSIALHATLAIGRNPVLKQRVADLVRKVAAGGPIEFNLGGVFIGTSSSDVIATFGNIGLPLSFSLKGGPSLLNGLLGGGENGTMDGKNPLSLKDIFKQTDGFDISTTDYGLDIEYKGIIFNPLPISLKVDYFAIQAQLANAGILAELDVGLSLGRGETPVSATLAIRLDRDARLADEVKTIVQDYFSKTDYNGLSLGGLSFGVSRIKAFDTLSLAFIPVKLPFSTMGSLSTLYGLGAADGKDVTVVAGGSNVNEQDGFLSFAKIMEFFKSALGPSSTLDVATTDYGLSAGFIGVINNTLPLSAHVGYFSIDVNLAGEAGRLARLEASLDLEKGSKAPINLGLRLVLSRGRAIAESVKEVFDDFIGKINYKGLAIGGIRLGSSEEKAFDLLSKAFINIPLNFEATPVLSSASLPVSTANPDPPAKPNIKAKLQQMMSFIEGIDIKTSSTGFSVVAGLSLSDVGMNLKIFVGHVSVDFLVSKVRLLTLAVDDLKFAGERVSVLHIPGSIIFSPEDPNIADSVADFINPLLRGETLSSLPFDLTNLKIGASAENAFDTFSLVDLVRKEKRE